MREWLSVIIGILILGILLDGLRRMRNNRRNSLRMRRLKDDDFTDDDGSVGSSEFPSGGARVAAVRDPESTPDITESLRKSYAASKMTRGAPKREPEQRALDLDTAVPMLMESVADKKKSNSEDVSDEPSLESDELYKEELNYEIAPIDDDNDNDSYDTDLKSDSGSSEDEVSPFAKFFPDSLNEPSLGSLTNLDDDDPEIVSSPRATAAMPDKPKTSSSSEKTAQPQKPAALKPEAHPPKKQTAPTEEAKPKARLPDEVLVIHVMAKKGTSFAGPDLLQALLDEGLRFGDMDIFHRHETEDGDGPVIFSLANTVMPGTFNLNEMETFDTPGVSLFLTLPIHGDSIAAYDLMALTAHNLASALSGELKDENRSVMTRQTIEHGRQRVVEYERKRRLAKA